MADSGKQVIMAGLDTDYMGRPFTPMPELLAHGRIDHQDAGHLRALRESGQAHAAPGGVGRPDRCGRRGMYEARCRRCFEPGIPKQTEMEFVRAKKQ